MHLPDEQEMRFRCLQLASGTDGPTCTAEIVAAAQRFYDFVAGNDKLQQAEPTKERLFGESMVVWHLRSALDALQG